MKKQKSLGMVMVYPVIDLEHGVVAWAKVRGVSVWRTLRRRQGTSHPPCAEFQPKRKHLELGPTSRVCELLNAC